MKSFFKKLSFVLAAAMIITLIPAQAAKAEGVIKLALQNAASVSDAISYDTLKVGEKQDYKFYGCLDYKTTGLGWVSSNEAVATVDKSGVVTAVAAGVAQISYEAKGYTTEAITLLVADEYDVNLAKQENKEVVTAFKFTAIGQEQDFCFVGAKGYSLNTHKCTWFSTNTAVATVDKVGNVTAVGEGNAQIVLTIVEKATNKVAFAVAPVAITVESAKLVVEQTAYNAAKVSFNDAPASDIKAYSLRDGIETLEYISVSGTAVTFYDSLEDGVTYIVRANGQEESFVASVGKVADFSLEYYGMMNDTKYTNEAYEGTVKFSTFDYKDAKGILVTNSGNTVTFTDVCNSNEAVFYENDAIYVNKGEVHTVTATITDANGAVLATKSVTFTVKEVPAWKLVSGEVRIGKVATGNAAATSYWDAKTNFNISVSDAATLGLAIRALDNRNVYWTDACGEAELMVNANGDFIDTNVQFIFESSNYDVLGVTDNGILEARNQGTATIFIYYKVYDNDLNTAPKYLLKTVTINVGAKRIPNSVKVNSASSTMYASGSYARLADVPGACNFNRVTFGFKVLDQYDVNYYDLQPYQVVIKNSADGTVVYDNRNGIDNGDFTIGYGTDWWSETRVIFTANDNHTNNVLTSYTATVTYRINNTNKSASVNIAVYNLEKMGNVVDHAIVWCPESATGLGNTDNVGLGADAEVIVKGHVVDVYRKSNVSIYGESVTESGVVLGDYNAVKNLTTAQLAPLYDDDVIYVQVAQKNNGSNVGSTYTVVTDGSIEIVARAAFNDLKNTTASAIDDATELAKIKNRDFTINTFKITKSVTAQGNTYKLAGVKTSGVKTLYNNDNTNYNLQLTLNTLVYDCDVYGGVGIASTNDEWIVWLTDNSSFTTNWDRVNLWGSYLYGDLNKNGRLNDEVGAVQYARAVATQVDTLAGTARYSKYIQTIDIFFAEDDGTVTKISAPVNKKITPINYDYLY